MKRIPDMDMVALRGAIRQAALALADSGVFGEWRAVRDALQGRFSADQLAAIFDSPFCRLDLNQRCHRAQREPRIVKRRETWFFPVTASDGAQRNEKERVLPDCRSKPRTDELLCERIVTVLVDGCPRTATELAQQLGVSLTDVHRTTRMLLTEGRVMVSGLVAGAHAGHMARSFTCVTAVVHRRAEIGSTRLYTGWPQADPVLTSAIQAIVRQGLHDGD